MLLIPFQTAARHKISSQGYNKSAVFCLAQYWIKQELKSVKTIFTSVDYQTQHSNSLLH